MRFQLESISEQVAQHRSELLVRDLMTRASFNVVVVSVRHPLRRSSYLAGLRLEGHVDEHARRTVLQHETATGLKTGAAATAFGRGAGLDGCDLERGPRRILRDEQARRDEHC